MQNLAIGLVLVGLALLVGAVLLVYQFLPDFGVTPRPSMEVKAPEDEDATLQLTVGGDNPDEEILKDAQYKLSIEHARELVGGQRRGPSRGSLPSRGS